MIVYDNKNDIRKGRLKTVMKIGLNILVDEIDLEIGFDEKSEKDAHVETSIGT